MGVKSVNDGILFDVSNFWHLPDSSDDSVGETTGIAIEMSVIYLADTNGTISKKGVFLVSGLEEVEVIFNGGGVEVVLQHDDVRVVENFVLVLGLEGVEGGEREGRLLACGVMGSRWRRGYDGGDED